MRIMYWALATLSLVEVWLVVRHILVLNGGIIYVVLCPWMALFSVLKLPGYDRSTGQRLQLGSQGNSALLFAAYVLLIIGTLDLGGLKGFGIRFIASASLLAVVHTVLLLNLSRMVAFTPTEPRVGVQRPLHIQVRPLVAFTMLIYLAIIVVAGVLVSARVSGYLTPTGPPALRSGGITLLYIAITSTFFAIIMLSRSEVRNAGFRWVMGVVFLISILSGLIEYGTRQDWYSYVLSAIAFLGVTAGIMRVVLINSSPAT